MFTLEQRQVVIRFRMAELEIESVAELARMANVDRGNLFRYISGDLTALGFSARGRLADALQIERPAFALLIGDESIAVPLGVDLNEPEIGKPVQRKPRSDVVMGAAWRGKRMCEP